MGRFTDKLNQQSSQLVVNDVRNHFNRVDVSENFFIVDSGQYNQLDDLEARQRDLGLFWSYRRSVCGGEDRE